MSRAFFALLDGIPFLVQLFLNLGRRDSQRIVRHLNNFVREVHRYRLDARHLSQGTLDCCPAVLT